MMARELKKIYLYSMVFEENQNIDSFRISQHRFIDSIIDKIHGKYADHVEGMRNDLFQNSP